MKLGRNLARTFLDYYKLQNHIVFNPTTSITPKLVGSNYLKNSSISQNLNINGYGSTNNGNNNNLNVNSNVNNGNGNISSIKTNNSIKRSSNNNIIQALKPLSSLSLAAAAGNSTSSMSNTSANPGLNTANTHSSQQSSNTEATSNNVNFSLG
jgi:hypothetical protein